MLSATTPCPAAGDFQAPSQAGSSVEPADRSPKRLMFSSHTHAYTPVSTHHTYMHRDMPHAPYSHMHMPHTPHTHRHPHNTHAQTYDTHSLNRTVLCLLVLVEDWLFVSTLAGQLPHERGCTWWVSVLCTKKGPRPVLRALTDLRHSGEGTVSAAAMKAGFLLTIQPV